MSKRIYQIEPNRWGYEILDASGSVCVRQEWNPDTPGWVAMSEAEADELASIVLARMS